MIRKDRLTVRRGRFKLLMIVGCCCRFLRGLGLRGLRWRELRLRGFKLRGLRRLRGFGRLRELRLRELRLRGFRLK